MSSNAVEDENLEESETESEEGGGIGAILTTLCINFVIMSVLLVVFSSVKKRHKAVYYPRLLFEP